VSRHTDGLGIASLVTGILSLVCSFACLGVLLGPAAAIMGLISRRRVASSAGTLGSAGIALAGLILGISGFIASVTWLVLLWRDSSFQQFLKAP
jgi:hypothetical protein